MCCPKWKARCRLATSLAQRTVARGGGFFLEGFRSTAAYFIWLSSFRARVVGFEPEGTVEHLLQSAAAKIGSLGMPVGGFVMI